jgi:ribonuclease HII
MTTVRAGRIIVCGVDEAGRGPLAGPVYAAAVILDPTHGIRGLDDSKRLAPEVRLVLAEKIKLRARAWAVASASVDEIDRFNILGATLLAMKRAVEGLAVLPHRVMVDGQHCPPIQIEARAVIDGDAKIKAISAASILAKTERDAEMCRWHERFPQYGFDRHKGYATPEHIEALRQHGPCELYRRSFAPVRALLAGEAVQVELFAWDD